MSLFAFGLGFSAERLISRGRLGAAAGTARSPESVAAWRARRVEAFVFDGERFDTDALAALARSRVALVSIPPRGPADPTLTAFAAHLTGPTLERIVYFSTVGVYGDTGGAWVDEASPTHPHTPRAKARLAAEAAWTSHGGEHSIAVDILRLGGIYGPGRSAFDTLREGKARAVVKPGQVFNRIHVDDIAAAVEAVVAARRPGAVYNVVDGSPSPPQDVTAYAAERLGLPKPPEVPFETADMSEMARSFYEENRRVRPAALVALGWTPAHPTYREGLDAILAAS